MSINDDILSRGLKERALLSLYEKKLDTDLTKVMSSHKKRLVNSALKNGNKSVNALNRALALETRKTYRKIYKKGISELKALANTSSKFHNSTLKESLGKVYRSKVYTGLKVNDLIINSAGTYSEQIASISLTQQRRIKDVVKKGMIENLAVNKIAKNVGDSIDLPSAQLKTLSRTAITETSSTISNATYKLNEDVIDGYQYVATLDSRTSMICGRLDGKVFRLDDSRGVRPPQHFNCRSTTVPIVKSYEDIANTKSSRISKRRLQRISKSKRASFNGQVASETNYAKFLSEQDDNFKLTVLGNKRRVEIFNTGKLKFTQFSTRDGELVSVGRLEELLNGVKVKPIKRVVKETVIKKSTTKVVNQTSVSNPIMEKDIKVIPLDQARENIDRSVQKAKLDKRYPLDENGVPRARFSASSLDVDGIGKTNLANMTDDQATKIAIIFEELNELADKYNIPRLRGIRASKKGSYLMSMGDGVLNINTKQLSLSRHGKNRIERTLNYRQIFKKDKITVAQYQDWKYGDKTIDFDKVRGKKYDRPYGAEEYIKNSTDLDVTRSVAYHEFGHHVHQMKYVKGNNKDYGINRRWKPPVEERIQELSRFERVFPTTYSKTNHQEWFAENFSMYTQKNRVDLVDPKFIEIIKELQE